METLNVFLSDSFAGILSYESNRMSFRYDSEYLQNPTSTPISFSMPLRAEAFDVQTSTAFFENLLPPDVIRKRLGKILHLSHHNIFGFLKALGGDCAGAVSLHPANSEHNVLELPRLRELSVEETCEILTGLPKRPLNLGREDGFRISGTGAQDKLIACVQNKKVFLPLYGTPSTHIIKPAIREYPSSVFNEFFCMRLAEAVKLPTPHCEILTFSDISYYCVTRYDRHVENGKIFRLHQEDFCQLSSIDPEKKYEIEGGPSISDCFRLIRKMRLGASDQLDFIRRIIFNFLIGNGDAHAKNCSVLYRGKSVALAPVYDLLSTEIYPTLSHETAMKIGNNINFGKINRADFAQMAHDCGINPDVVFDQIDLMTAILCKQADRLAGELKIEHPSVVYPEIISVIKKQSEQILRASVTRT